DKQRAIKKLGELSRKLEEGFTPNGDFQAVLDQENRNAHKYGGRRISAEKKKPVRPSGQLGLFE
ncbi:MAG: DUF763 domain-containing protein, partial [Bacteroidota bacterium]